MTLSNNQRRQGNEENAAQRREAVNVAVAFLLLGVVAGGLDSCKHKSDAKELPHNTRLERLMRQ